MKAYRVEILCWERMPVTFTGHESASKARYAAMQALNELITGIKFSEIKINRAKYFDSVAHKLKNRFLEHDQMIKTFGKEAFQESK